MFKLTLLIVLFSIAIAQDFHYAAEEENPDHKAQKHVSWVV